MKWAVGLKDWVEVRSASTQPHKHISYLPITQTKLIPEETGLDAWGYQRFRAVKKTVTKKLTHVSFSGGKVVETLSREKFRRKYGLSCPCGTCIPLEKENPDEPSDG